MDTATLIRQTALGVTALLALGLTNTAAYAQSFSEQTLYSFGSTATDGQNPYAPLVNAGGILYGTTFVGGAGSAGTVFSIDPSTHLEKTIYTFAGTSSDGAYPLFSMFDVNGILYGTTSQGSANGPSGPLDGTIFSIDLNGNQEKILYSFQYDSSNNDGKNPYAGLTENNGIFYGTTLSGGRDNLGTVFSINPDGSGYQTLYQFTGTNGDGANPEGDLLAVNGVFYGTTYAGGTHDKGVLFTFDPVTQSWKSLHSFSGTNDDGAYPMANLIDVGGIFYGTTSQGGADGGGTVFSINADGTGYQTLYSFGANGKTDGYRPVAGLIALGGLLYGTTTSGGPVGAGTVFSIDPTTHREKIVYSFQGASKGDGASPQASLIDVSGSLYGTTSAGGSHGDGTVFSLLPISAPVARNNGATIYHNTTRTFAAPGVLANDNSGNDSPLTARLVQTTIHGSLTLHSDGSFIYTPNAGYSGIDTFTYRVANPLYQGNTATVVLSVLDESPVAFDDACTINHNTSRTNPAPGVLSNDDDGGDGPLTAALVQTTTHGSLQLHSDGSFTYTPNTGYSGTDSFTYRVASPFGQGNIATVTLTVK